MIPYIGGKYRQAKWINQYVNTTNSKTYIEPFGGMFWNFLRNQEKFEQVVYNDFNPYNSNLFLCMKNHSDFYEYIKYVRPLDFDRFYRYQELLYHSNLDFQFNKEEPAFEVGLMYSYVITHTYSGTNPEKAKCVVPGPQKPKFEVFKSKLINPKWTRKLDEITDIECMSYEKILRKYDSEDTHFFIDPPYWKTESYYSNHTFSNYKNHVQLSSELKELKGKFSLTYYYFDQITKFYKPDEFFYTTKEYHKSSGNKRTGKEYLITNYNSNHTGVPEFSEPTSTMGEVEIIYDVKYNILNNDHKRHFRFSIIQGVINRKFGNILRNHTSDFTKPLKNEIFYELFEMIIEDLGYSFCKTVYKDMLYSKFLNYFVDRFEN